MILQDLTLGSYSIDIPLNLKDIRGPEWPEIVDNGNMIMGGKGIQSSVSAIPKNMKK